MKSKKQNLGFLVLVAAIGEFLFGYDWVVIGGAKIFYEPYFNITQSKTLQGFVMGSAILGCILGSMVSGGLADRFGRKPLLVFSAVLFIMAALWTGIAETLTIFILFRIAGGIGIGIASNISPIYIAEIAPSENRGKYVAVNQLSIVLGILSAQIINWLLTSNTDPLTGSMANWNLQYGWRWMFWAGGIPAVLFLILLFFIPESPRWLTHRKNTEGKMNTGAELTSLSAVNYKFEEINSPSFQSGFGQKFRHAFRGKAGGILMLGIVLSVFQQWSGINVIFNYAQEVFSSAGYEVSGILFNIVVTGITNVIFTIAGMYLVDHIGRKALLLIGSSGLAIIYLVLGILYQSGIAGLPVLVLVILAIACYAMTLAPVIWVVLSELFPMKYRGLAMAISTFCLWTACFILTYTFPILNSSLGAHGTFWLYGFICISGFFYILRFLPETRGKSLEQIEKELYE